MSAFKEISEFRKTEIANGNFHPKYIVETSDTISLAKQIPVLCYPVPYFGELIELAVNSGMYEPVIEHMRGMTIFGVELLFRVDMTKIKHRNPLEYC